MSSLQVIEGMTDEPSSKTCFVNRERPDIKACDVRDCLVVRTLVWTGATMDMVAGTRLHVMIWSLSGAFDDPIQCGVLRFRACHCVIVEPQKYECWQKLSTERARHDLDIQCWGDVRPIAPHP